MRTPAGTVSAGSSMSLRTTSDVARFVRSVLCCCVVLVLTGAYQVASGQDNSLSLNDYEFFGRKVPMTLGSSFGTLGSFTPYENPAELAFVNDNRIAIDRSISPRGAGIHVSLSAPNFSISGAVQDSKNDTNFVHTKNLLLFSFGFAIGDPSAASSRAIALGLALNPKSDLLAVNDVFFGDTLMNGGMDSVKALALVLGGIIKLGNSRISIAIHDLVLAGDKEYPVRIVLGYQTITRFGLRLAFQGMPGTGYGPSSNSTLGLKLGLAQSFFNGRLDSRVQLESFFDDSGEATMQSITGGVGYRMKPRRLAGGLAALLDTEFSYTLSFLAVPNVIGTHMFGLVKYF